MFNKSTSDSDILVSAEGRKAVLLYSGRAVTSLLGRPEITLSNDDRIKNENERNKKRVSFFF